MWRSRLVPPQAGTADRVYGGASETPPVSPGFAVGGDMPSSLARTPRTQQALELSSSSQPGRLSTAMERVIRLERKRAGKSYRRNLSSLWSSMHYILRTARCIHAWRSDTVAAVNKRMVEAHGAELRAKDASRKRLEEEHQQLRRAFHAHEGAPPRSPGNSGDDLAARVVLLQELQKRTETEHANEVASVHHELERTREENNRLRAQDSDMQMNSSMATLVVKCQMLEDELRALRSASSLSGTSHLPEGEVEELRDRLELTQQKLTVAEAEITRLLREARSQPPSVYDDSIAEVRRKHEEEMAEMMAKIQQELENLRMAKEEEVTALQKKHWQEAQASAGQQEAEMIALRSQWETQMQDLRRQHEDHMRVAIAKDLMAEELDRVNTALLRRDEEVANMQTRYDEDKNVIFQERLKKEEELSEAKQEVRELGWKTTKQQEELVMLRGSLRRAEEDEGRLSQEVQDLRAAISSRENDFTALHEQNLALEDNAKAKDDKIVQLESIMNQHKDVRTLVHEHDAIVDKFRAEALKLHQENEGLKMRGNGMKMTVDSLRDELRCRVLELHGMGAKLEMDIGVFEKTLLLDGGVFGELEEMRRALDAQRAEADGLRHECEMLRSEIARVEDLAASHAAQVEQARAVAFEAESVGWDRAKLQEELVVLRGTSRRKDEDRLKLDLEISSLQDATAELEEKVRAKQEEIESVTQESQKTIEEQVALRILAESEAEKLQQQVYVMRGEHAQQLQVLSTPQEVSANIEESLRDLERARSELVESQDALASKEEACHALDARLQEICPLLEKAESQLQQSERKELELRDKLGALEKEQTEHLQQCEVKDRELQDKIAALEKDGAEHKELAEGAMMEKHRHMEEISTLKALVRRGQDDKEKERAAYESQIVELQVSLGSAHRELRLREDELNDTVERARKEEENNPVIDELRARHGAEIASIHRIHSAGVEELKRIHETSTEMLKVEFEGKISDMKAALDYRVENATLGLKLKAAEGEAARYAADKQLVKCEAALRGVVRDLVGTVEEIGLAEKKLDGALTSLKAKEAQVASLQAKQEELQVEVDENSAAKAQALEKDAAVGEYVKLVAQLREERDDARAEHQHDAENGMKVQEEIVLLRGSSRRKDEETRKYQAENVALREDLERNQHESQRFASQMQSELQAKDSILAKMKADQEALAADVGALKEAHNEDIEKIGRKFDLEKRELLRESEQRNVELAGKAAANSSLLVEVENLKEELLRVQTHREDHQRQTDLKEEELIDFKGKHVAMVEELTIELRNSEKEVARLETLAAEHNGDLESHKEQVSMLRESEAKWKVELQEWADKHHMNVDAVRTKDEAISSLENELKNSQEHVEALEKQVEDLKSDLASEVQSQTAAKNELVLLRGEVRRRNDELKKMEDSQGNLQNTVVEHTTASQDEIEGLWLGMRRKDEELAELRQQLELAQVQSKEGQVEIESLLREKKALKDFQSMVRGKAKLEKQELLHSNAKQRREQEHKEHLIRQALDERSKRQQLQLSWASLEQTMQLLCPPFAESRFHLLFTAKSSLFKVDGGADEIHMRTSVHTWLRGTFAKALNVEEGAVSVSHLSWGSMWVGSVRSIDDQVQAWSPQVPEGHRLAIALVRFHSVPGSFYTASQLAEKLCALMKTRGSALYQHLEPSRTTVLGCLPPQKALDGEECLLPSQVAARMIVVEDLGFALFSHQNGDYVVSFVLPGSVASEYEKLAPGDIVSEIDGVLVRKRPLADVSQLLTGKHGSTVALLVCRGQDAETLACKESNLVIMARPSVPVVSPSPLAKARDSMMHPDLSELLATGDFNASMASMAVQPSMDGAHLDFGDSILADQEQELTSAEIAGRSAHSPGAQADSPAHDAGTGDKRNGHVEPQPKRTYSPRVSPRRSPSPIEGSRGVPLQWETLDL